MTGAAVPDHRTEDDDSAYAQHTGVSRPGEHATLLRALPADPRRLVPHLRNVLGHHTRAEGFAAGTGRADDGTELRPVRSLLDRITAVDDRPWHLPRRPGSRLVVDCRSLAVVMCAVLREHGVPARVRFGFAGYLAPGHWQSHVVCEHLTGGGWVRTDPDIGLFDLGIDDFVDAGQAWRGAWGTDLADRYGYSAELRGRWTLRYELARDLAALTGFEPLTSDVWGLIGEPPEAAASHDELFDEVAAAGDRRRWLELAATPAFAVPAVITTAPYLTGAVYRVDLVAEGSRDSSRDSLPRR